MLILMTNDPIISRRSFLALMGVGACLVGVAGMTSVSFLGFLYPNAMKIPPSVFSIGRPEEGFSAGWKNLYPKPESIYRNKVRKSASANSCMHPSGMHCQYGGYRICCPCHGSTYDRHGRNTGGPAPLPLVYFLCSKAASGDLMVDKTKTTLDWETAWFRLMHKSRE